MTEESRDHQVKQFLAAFADGELDIEQTIEILSRLSMDPATAARVEHQQRLRESVARVMQAPQCKGHPTRCPEALREKIEAAFASQGDDEPASSSAPDSQTNVATPRRRPGVLAALGRWSPLAAAAVVLLAALGLYLQSGIDTPAGERPGTAASSILPAAVAAKMDRRHGECSADTRELLAHAQFPDSIRELPEVVARQLDISGPGVVPLDLSVLGYRYVEAGRCAVPGKPAVHVVYRTDGTTAADAPAMSLWITPDRGQFDALRDARVFMARITETHHPVMLWKRGGLVYLLLGETLADVESAANMLWARGRDALPDNVSATPLPARANTSFAG